MDKRGLLREGNDEDRFVITRGQARRLADSSYDLGKNGLFASAMTFHYVRKLNPADNWAAEQVARAKWLHIVTAKHLRKARGTIRGLRAKVDRLERLLDEQREVANAYRGDAGRNPCWEPPEHYRGDGYVTCDRAIEAASAQRCIAKRTKLQFWYWATAVKYVWRMWSKQDPVADAHKAVDCILRSVEGIDG